MNFQLFYKINQNKKSNQFSALRKLTASYWCIFQLLFRISPDYFFIELSMIFCGDYHEFFTEKDSKNCTKIMHIELIKISGPSHC